MVSILDALTLKIFLTHITIETEEENDFVKGRMAKGGTSFVWTSGRKCNFDGCHDRPDLQPTIVKAHCYFIRLTPKYGNTDCGVFKRGVQN